MVHTKHSRGNRDPTASVAHVAGKQFQVTDGKEGAAQACQRTTDHQGKGLQENDIDTHCLSGTFVFAYST